MKFALANLTLDERGRIKGSGPGKDFILIKEADEAQFSVIKSWGRMKWDKKIQCLYGRDSLDLLDKLAELTPLSSTAEKQRQALRRVPDAVDHERVKETPIPLCDYPVKMPLYSHQVKGANMCLLTFGWADPEGSEKP